MTHAIRNLLMGVLTFAFMCTPTQSKANEASSGDAKSAGETAYSFNYRDNGDGTVALSKYDADGRWLPDPISPSPVGDFTVPGEIDGKQVVAIGDWYFDGCNDITSLVIPASVTDMRSDSFWYASGITNITVAAGNPSYKDIDGVLYTKDGKTLVFCPRAKGGEIAVASGTEEIGPGAFYVNDKLRSITIPESVTAIRREAFLDCHTLEGVALPQSLLAIGDSAFAYCDSESFTSVTIPAAVETIGERAFGNCSSLASVTFAGDEEDIDIDGLAFAGTPYDAAKPFSLVVQYDTLVGIHGTAPENLVLADYLEGQRVPYIGSQALSQWSFYTSSVTNIVVPEGVMFIGDYAFSGCTALQSVTLPTSLYEIYYGAFSDCTSLRSVRIPPKVMYIEEPFEGCTNLTVTVPSFLRDTFSVPEENDCRIEYYEVPQCTVTFNANGGTVDDEPTVEVTTYEGHVLGEEGYDEWGEWGRRLPQPVRDGYMFGGWFTAAEGGEKVTPYTEATGDMTLYAHWEELPANDNFADAQEIETSSGAVYVSNIMMTAEEGEENYHNSTATLWYKWTGTETVIMTIDTEGSDFDTVLGVYTGSQFENLEQIAYNDDCESSSTSCVTFGAKAGVTYYIMVGGYSSQTGNIRLSWKSEEIVHTWSYEEDEGGGVTITGVSPSFGDIEIPAEINGRTVTGIADEAFYEAGISSVRIPGTVKVIGWGAFSQCVRLSDVVIEEGVQVIGSNAFANNYSLEEIAIPASVVKIEANAFWFCSRLATVTFAGDEGAIDISYKAFSYTPYEDSKGVEWIVDGNGVLTRCIGACPTELVIPPGVKAIGNSVFYPWGENGNPTAQSIRTVDFGEELEAIGSYAFYNCNNIGSLEIPGNVKTIGSCAFSACYGLRSVTICEGVEEIGDCAFGRDNVLEELTLPSSIKKIGYNIVGDTDNEINVTVKAPWSLFGMIESGKVGKTTIEVVFYGEKPPTRMVTFNVNGGDPIGTSEKEVLDGKPIGALPVPRRGGHAFLGWFTDAEGGERVRAETVATADMTLYAHWEESPFTRMSEDYPWTVDGDGNWINGEIPPWANTWMEVDVEGPCKVSFLWRRINGYMVIYVDGYYYSGGGSADWVRFAETFYDNRTHTIRFELNASLYEGMPQTGVYYQIADFKAVHGDVCSVALDPNGGVWQSAEDGESITTMDDFSGVYLPEPVPTSPNMEFAGWWTALDESGEQVTAATSVVDGMTIYARWQARETAPEWYWEAVEDDDGKPVGVEVSGYDADFAGTLEIPSQIEGLPVIGIAEYAFEGFSIAAVTIPASVQTIGDFAFYNCRRLETVTFAGDESDIEMNKYIAFAATPWLPRPGNDEYEDAQLIEGASGSVAGSLAGATSAEIDCIWDYDDPVRTIWYKWVSPFTGEARFSATADNDKTDLLYLGATYGYDSENEEWNDCGYDYGSKVTFDVEEGRTYYVSVRTWNYVVEGLTLSWSEYVPPPPPENDNFAAAIELAGEAGDTTGRNTSATAEDGLVFTDGENGDVWWKWTAPKSGLAAFDTHGSDYDTSIAIVEIASDEGDSPELDCIASDDDYYSDNTSRVEFCAEAGKTYYIAVGGYSTGDIALGWSFVASGGAKVEAYDEYGMPATVEPCDDGGFVVKARKGVTLYEEDIFVAAIVDGEVVETTAGYNIVVAEDGKSARVTLKAPSVGVSEAVAEDERPAGDADDPTGVLVSVDDIGKDAVSAKPDVDESAGEELGALPVKAVKGLSYRASWGDSLGEGGMTDGDWVQADDDDGELYLGVVKQKGEKGFYRVSVADREF